MSRGLSVRGILGDGWDRSRIFGRLCGRLIILEDVVVREGVGDVGVERLESVSGHCRGLERGMWFMCAEEGGCRMSLNQVTNRSL